MSLTQLGYFYLRGLYENTYKGIMWTGHIGLLWAVHDPPKVYCVYTRSEGNLNGVR